MPDGWARRAGKVFMIIEEATFVSVKANTSPTSTSSLRRGLSRSLLAREPTCVPVHPASKPGHVQIHRLPKAQ